MGMANPEPIYYTADMVRELVDESRPWPRYECVYGELLVSPAPKTPHQTVATRLLYRLTAYVDAMAVDAVVYMSPADISFGPARAAWRGEGWPAITWLLLATEVLSPSTRHADRFRKRRLYQDEGVPLYWIIDRESESAEIWTPEAHFPTIERERLVWHPEGAAEPFVCPLAELYAEP
jgi:Uma2 family endonuclease